MSSSLCSSASSSLGGSVNSDSSSEASLSMSLSSVDSSPPRRRTVGKDPPPAAHAVAAAPAAAADLSERDINEPVTESASDGDADIDELVGQVQNAVKRLNSVIETCRFPSYRDRMEDARCVSYGAGRCRFNYASTDRRGRGGQTFARARHDAPGHGRELGPDDNDVEYHEMNPLRRTYTVGRGVASATVSIAPARPRYSGQVLHDGTQAGVQDSDSRVAAAVSSERRFDEGEQGTKEPTPQEAVGVSPEHAEPHLLPEPSKSDVLRQQRLALVQSRQQEAKAAYESWLENKRLHQMTAAREARARARHEEEARLRQAEKERQLKAKAEEKYDEWLKAYWKRQKSAKAKRELEIMRAAERKAEEEAQQRVRIQREVEDFISTKDKERNKRQLQERQRRLLEQQIKREQDAAAKRAYEKWLRSKRGHEHKSGLGSQGAFSSATSLLSRPQWDDNWATSGLGDGQTLSDGDEDHDDDGSDESERGSSVFEVLHFKDDTRQQLQKLRQEARSLRRN